MHSSEKLPRLSRLTALLVRLQEGRYLRVQALAEEFQVSRRTIYRDLAVLEEAGLPLSQEDGRGFALMQGYTLPPIMFTEAEANALILAHKMVAQTKDHSLIEAHKSAMDKVRAVLDTEQKEKVQLLAERTIIGRNWHNETLSGYLTEIQTALVNFRLLELAYLKEAATEVTIRQVEPFAIYHNPNEYWVLIAWCRLRKAFRNFRVDRIQQLRLIPDQFEPHKITMEEYVEIQRKKHFGEA